MTPKFQIGDTVKFHVSSEQTSHDNEAGQITEMHFDGNEWSYKFTAQYYDFTEHKMIEGFKWCKESEIINV